MTVHVLLFSVLSEKVGRKSLEVTLDAPSTAGDLWVYLSERYEALEPYRNTVRIAVNQTYADAGQPLEDGDEVALITPVSGG